MKDRTLVVISAHADDAELNAGGLMAKWTAEGGKVQIVMGTNNCSGEFIPDNGDETKLYRKLPVECTAARHAEQEAAAAMIGAKVHYLGYPQRHWFSGREVVRLAFSYKESPPPGVSDLPPLLIAFQRPEHVERMATLLVSLKPDLVITQPTIDMDPEHHALACMVWQAFQARKKELDGVPLWFWTPGSTCVNGLFDPNYDHIVDITPYYEKKLQLCAAHKGQMIQQRWSMVRERAEYFGGRIGAKYAEPYKSALL